MMSVRGSKGRGWDYPIQFHITCPSILLLCTIFLLLRFSSAMNFLLFAFHAWCRLLLLCTDWNVMPVFGSSSCHDDRVCRRRRFGSAKLLHKSLASNYAFPLEWVFGPMNGWHRLLSAPLEAAKGEGARGRGGAIPCLHLQKPKRADAAPLTSRPGKSKLVWLAADVLGKGGRRRRRGSRSRTTEQVER